jgi:hypothetical protein
MADLRRSVLEMAERGTSRSLALSNHARPRSFSIPWRLVHFEQTQVLSAFNVLQ